jgi:hypothetical protein
MIDAIRELGGEVALGCALEIDTGTGGRLVHVEPGHRLDAGAAFTDPFDPNDRPLAVHIAREVAPAIVANNGATWRKGSPNSARLPSRLAFRSYRNVPREAAYCSSRR